LKPLLNTKCKSRLNLLRQGYAVQSWGSKNLKGPMFANLAR